MAPGKPGGAGRSRGEDPRSVRPAPGRGRQVAPPRVLDVRAARLIAGDLLSRRAWTRAELATRLRRRGAPDDVVMDVVDDFTARGHIDDRAFALRWVETRAARGYGAVRLRAELRLRGVAPSLIVAALASLAVESQLGQARAVARRRYPAFLRTAPARAATRLRDHLLRRGFSAPVVIRVVREVAPRAGEAD